MRDKIYDLLKQKFHPEHLVVTDDSHQHAGHNPQADLGGTHFSVEITSQEFTGKTRLERHRMIYAVLAQAFESNLHALAIKALSPQELSGS